MKILMITDNLMKGGKERRLLELLSFFETISGINIQLVILRDKIEYSIVHELKNTELIVLKRKIKKDPTIFFRLWRICSETKPDLVHSWGSQPSIYMSPICFLQKIPLLNGMISNAHFKKFSTTWLRAKLTFPFSKKIISNSRAGIEAYGASSQKSCVIYNGVHLSRFEKLPDTSNIRNELEITKPYIIGMVGAFHQRKDYSTYLEAAKKISSQRDDICFLAIGDGSSLEHFKSMYKDVPSNKLKFLGNQDHVEKIINLFDIGVLLTDTRVHQEGISNAIIEYMALGKPVIATRGGGTNELIEDDVNGFLVESLNVDMFIDKLLLLLDNESIRINYGKNNRKKIKTNFTVSAMTDKYLTLYNELINKK